MGRLMSLATPTLPSAPDLTRLPAMLTSRRVTVSQLGSLSSRIRIWYNALANE